MSSAFLLSILCCLFSRYVCLSFMFLRDWKIGSRTELPFFSISLNSSGFRSLMVGIP